MRILNLSLCVLFCFTRCSKTETTLAENLREKCASLEGMTHLSQCQRNLTGLCSNAELDVVLTGLGDPMACDFYEDKESLEEGVPSKCVAVSNTCLDAIALWKARNASNAEAEVAPECVEQAGTASYENRVCVPVLEDYKHCTSLGCTCTAPFGGALCNTLFVDDVDTFPKKTPSDSYFYNSAIALPTSTTDINSKKSRWRLYIESLYQAGGSRTFNPDVCNGGVDGRVVKRIPMPGKGVEGVKELWLPNMVFTYKDTVKGFPATTRAQGPGYFEFSENGCLTGATGTYQYARGVAYFRIDAVFKDKTSGNEERIRVLTYENKQFSDTSVGRVVSGIKDISTRVWNNKTYLYKEFDPTLVKDKKFVALEYQALQVDIGTASGVSGTTSLTSFEPTSLEEDLNDVYINPNCSQETNTELQDLCKKEPKEYVLTQTTNQIRIVTLYDTTTTATYCTSLETGTFKGYNCGLDHKCLPGETCCGDGVVQKPLEKCEKNDLGCDATECVYNQCAVSDVFLSHHGARITLNKDIDSVDKNTSLTLSHADCPQGSVLASNPVLGCTEEGWDNKGVVVCEDLFKTTPLSASTVLKEKEGSAAWEVRLGVQPTHDVRVSFTASLPSDVTYVPNFVFTPQNYAVPQVFSVQGVQDLFLEDTETVSIHADVTSNDTRYQGALLAFSDVLVQDSNQPSAVVSSSTNVQMLPEGRWMPLCLTLNAQPQSTVTVSSPSNIPDLMFQPSSLVFTSTTWNVLQCFKVTSIADNVSESAETHLVSFSLMSNETRWNGVSVEALNVQTIDMWTPPQSSFNVPSSTLSVVFQPSVLETHESGVPFTVLISVPNDASVPEGSYVTWAWSVSHAYEASVFPSTVKIRKGETASVLVKGVDDSFKDGDIAYQLEGRIVLEETSSYFASWAGTVYRWNAVNKDNDGTPVVFVTPLQGTLAEPSGFIKATFTSSVQPLMPVRIPLSLPMQTKVSLSTQEVVLTPEAWNTGVEVMLSVIDNTEADGPRTLVLNTAHTISSEEAFNNLAVPDITLVQTDNDVPVCGNNLVEQGERCDGGAWCSNDCTSQGPASSCGNGVKEAFETCDMAGLNKALATSEGIWCNNQSTPSCDVLPYHGNPAGSMMQMQKGPLDALGRSTGTGPVLDNLCESNAVATGIRTSNSLYPHLVCRTVQENNLLGAVSYLEPFPYSSWYSGYDVSYRNPTAFHCPEGMVLVGQSLVPRQVLSGQGPGGRCRPWMSVLLASGEAATHHDGNTLGLNEPQGAVHDYCPPGFVVHGFYASTSSVTTGFGMRCKRFLPYADRSQLPMDTGVRVVATSVSNNNKVYESGSGYTFKVKLSGASLTQTVKVRVIPSAELDVGMGVGVAKELSWSSLQASLEHTVSVTASNNTVPEGDRPAYVYIAGADNTYVGDSLAPLVLTLSDTNLAPSDARYDYPNPIRLIAKTNGISASLSYRGGKASTFSIFSGSMPSGLMFDNNTGSITGTPSATGAFNITVRAQNDAGFADVPVSFIVTGVCGNNLVEYGEECDGGASCSFDCKNIVTARCGDGVLNPALEVCDNGSSNRPSTGVNANLNDPTNSGTPFCLDTCDNLPLIGALGGGFRFSDVPLNADNTPNNALAPMPRVCGQSEVATGISYWGKCYYTLLCSNASKITDTFRTPSYDTKLQPFQHGTRPWCPDAVPKPYDIPSASSSPLLLTCPSNSVIVGQVLPQYSVSGSGWWYAIGPAARCASIADVRNNVDFRNSANQSRLTGFLNQTNAQTSRYGYIAHYCPPGFVVTGFYTRTGWAMNAFGMRCSPLSSRQ
jgi:hypothetical protein